MLFGLLWSLAFHLLNGIRHLAWDLGYGFKVSTARLTGALVYVFSVLLAAGAFVVGIMVRQGLGGGAGCLLGGEVAHAGNQLHAHVVRVPLVAMELVWSNHTVVRTEEKQCRRPQRAIAVPAWTQRELAQRKLAAAN